MCTYPNVYVNLCSTVRPQLGMLLRMLHRVQVPREYVYIYNTSHRAVMIIRWYIIKCTFSHMLHNALYSVPILYATQENSAQSQSLRTGTCANQINVTRVSIYSISFFQTLTRARASWRNWEPEKVGPAPTSTRPASPRTPASCSRPSAYKHLANPCPRVCLPIITITTEEEILCFLKGGRIEYVDFFYLKIDMLCIIIMSCALCYWNPVKWLTYIFILVSMYSDIP